MFKVYNLFSVRILSKNSFTLLFTTKTSVINITLFISLIFLFSCKENANEFPENNISVAPLLTINEIHKLYKTGELTCEELVEACLDRIKTFDKKGPELNALITINQNAIDEAKKLDKTMNEKGINGALFGIPIILKDNYNTHDLPTTGGSAILKNSIPIDDAFIVGKLREAGAIIIGKANMSEFALSYGWLGYGSIIGQTKNPHNTLRDPSGSSSGSAVAITVGYALLGTGTDTAGSIRAPGAVCGIVGIKPTIGLLSRNGIIPASLTLDVPGPLARTVSDAAIMLEVMYGYDENDTSTVIVKDKHLDFVSALDKKSLNNSRIGLVKTFSGANAEVDSLFDVSIKTLQKEGAELFDVELTDPLHNLWTIMGIVVDADFYPQIEEYLKTLPEGSPKTLEDLIEIAESDEIKNSSTPLNPARLQGFKDALATGGYANPLRKEHIEKLIPAIRKQILDIMDQNNLEALVFPTISCPASVRHDAEDSTYYCDTDDTYRSCYLASTSGFPEITVPAGFTDDGMPVGLSFFGRPLSEEKLIGFAYDYEQASKHYKLPKSTPILVGK